MKLVNAASLLAALAIAGYAYGDSIVAGSVSNRNLAGGSVFLRRGKLQFGVIELRLGRYHGRTSTGKRDRRPAGCQYAGVSLLLWQSHGSRHHHACPGEPRVGDRRHLYSDWRFGIWICRLVGNLLSVWRRWGRPLWSMQHHVERCDRNLRSQLRFCERDRF